MNYKRVEIVEEVIGVINGRVVAKLQGHKHDVMTKRILYINPDIRFFSTSETMYTIPDVNTISVDKLLEIANDIKFYEENGDNQVRWMRQISLEKPNDIMKKRFT